MTMRSTRHTLISGAVVACRKGSPLERHLGTMDLGVEGTSHA